MIWWDGWEVGLGFLMWELAMDAGAMDSVGVGVGDFRGENNREDIAAILSVARRHLQAGDPAAALQAVSGAWIGTDMS